MPNSLPNDKTLTLLGGNVTAEGGQLTAWAGRVEISSVISSGSVGLDINEHLHFAPELLRGNVALTQQSLVDVALNNGGEIVVTASNIRVSDSSLLAGIAPGFGTVASQAGNLILDATEEIHVEQTSRIANDVNSKLFNI